MARDTRGIRKKRLYQCDDCKSRRFVDRIELDRAARPRCHGCGSTRLELVSDDGREEQVMMSSARVSGSIGAGSVVPSKEAE